MAIIDIKPHLMEILDRSSRTLVSYKGKQYIRINLNGGVIWKDSAHVPLLQGFGLEMEELFSNKYKDEIS